LRGEKIGDWRPLPVDESGDSTMKIEEIKIKYPTVGEWGC